MDEALDEALDEDLKELVTLVTGTPQLMKEESSSALNMCTAVSKLVLLSNGLWGCTIH